MGGKIGIETLLDIEKHFLAECIAHSVIKHSVCEKLRQSADLRMDWQTTVELSLLHYFVWEERLTQFDLDGELFMQEILVRVGMHLNLRRKEMEKVLQVAINEKESLGPYYDTPAQFARQVAYKKAFIGTDMELAEALWTFLAPSEDFELEDDDSGKNQLIVDRYFNPEGIEYLVHYIRKNIALLDEKSFLDFKLVTNFVDTNNETILKHQRYFREFVFGFCLPENQPLQSNRKIVEACLEFDYGQKQNMSWLQKIGVVQYHASGTLEAELERDLEDADKKYDQFHDNLLLFMKDKDRLNLFDQTGNEFKRKSGRITRVS